MTVSPTPTRSGRGCLGAGVGVPRAHGTPRLSSEPDLVAADTGHSIDVAQHGETDET